jgi:hypothetical protein
MVTTTLSGAVLNAARLSATTFQGLTDALLGAGEDVAFYDPNDLTSVYAARTGGANATVNGVVGLMLDKAQMGGLTAAEYLAALDTPELVTNGTFDTDVSGWSAGVNAGTIDWDNGAAVVTNDGTAFVMGVSAPITLEVGKTYQIKLDCLEKTSFQSTIAVSASSTNKGISAQITEPPISVGSFTVIFKSTITSAYLHLLANGAGAVTFDNISVKEIPGYHATAPSDAARPILRDVSSTYALDFDNVDDAFAWTTPAIANGTWVALTRNGSYAASAAYSAGTYTMPIYQPFDLCAILWTSADLTTVQEAIVLAEGSARGAAADFGGVTNFTGGWRLRADLRDFPVIDTSSGTNFLGAWNGCTGLTSFPLLDVNSGTVFQGAWFGCTGLTSFPAINFGPGGPGATFFNTWNQCTSLADFPANMFDSVTATNFAFAFLLTNLTQTSIDNILTSINTAGTSGGTFNQSGGSAPSATGKAAIDALRARGWTVTVTGGY